MATPDSNPGPGRSTADAAVKAIKQQIAERNEKAHQAYRKLREPKERAEREAKRRRDAL